MTQSWRLQSRCGPDCECGQQGTIAKSCFVIACCQYAWCTALNIQNVGKIDALRMLMHPRAELVLQAAKDADVDGATDPQGWKKSFVKAMNHLARLELKDGTAVQDNDDACSVAEGSVAESHVNSATSASQRRADAAAELRAKLDTDAAEPDWDRSTCISGSTNKGKVAFSAVVPYDLVRENPALKLVHSAQSLKAVVARQEQHARVGACA